LGRTGAPVEQLAQFDADVGHHARDVRCADFRMRELGDQRVLQAHHETEQHDRGRHEQPLHVDQMAAKQAEAQQQRSLEQQWNRKFAAQARTARPVDQERRGGRARQERDQRANAVHHQHVVAQDQFVRNRGNDAGHMGRVLLHREEAARVGRTGHEAQHARQPAIGDRVPLMGGQTAQVPDRHGRKRRGFGRSLNHTTSTRGAARQRRPVRRGFHATS